MMFASVFVLSLIMFGLSVRPAHAIIVIIPTVLIPVVSVVVWIIGAISAPVIGLSALYFNLKKKSTVKGVLFGALLILLIGIFMTIIFKLIDPNRPIY